MADLSDRERLEKLALEKEQSRQAEIEEQKLRQVEEAKVNAQLLATDQNTTLELFKYCKEQFQGFKLVPTEHEVSVDRASRSVLHGIESDGIDFVSFNVTHWSDETGHFQGLIPILLTRYRKTQYIIIDVDGKQHHAKTFEEVKQQLINCLSDTGRDSMRRLFANVRSRLARR